jgi:hypothetical protein
MRQFTEVELRGYLKDEYLVLQDQYEDSIGVRSL